MTVETSNLYAFRCKTCWQPNVASQEIAGSETVCEICGAEFEAPEATPERIALVEELENSGAIVDSSGSFHAATGSEMFAAGQSQVAAYPMQLEGFDVSDGELDFSNYWLASRMSRLVAVLIDGVVLTIATAFGVVAMIAMSKYGFVDMPKSQNEIPLLAIAIVGFVPLVIMIVQWNMTVTSGRTIGKLLVGIRIVSMNGKLPGFFFGVFLRSWVMTLVYYIPFMQLIDILFIFGGGRRCLHDWIAGTRVVEG